MNNDKKLPKVLVIGINAWREDGTAHTLMDIFRCWNPERVALIYARADMPNTEVCHRYFQISESQMIRSVLKPWIKVGRVVENTPVVKFFLFQESMLVIFFELHLKFNEFKFF